jgi:class III cytochrome C family protein
MRSLARWLGLAVTALAAARVTGAAAQGAQVVECVKCHGNREFLAGKGGTSSRDSALYQPAGVLENSVHAGLQCSDCHRGFEAGYPHRVAAKVVSCQSCHEEAGRDWAASIHAANAAAQGDAPTCVGCHGSHTVYGTKDPKSPTYALNVAAMCARCHGDPRIIGTYFAAPGKEQGRIAAGQFPKSVHGVALSRAGLLVSATCSDCHRAHKILPADSAGSSVNRANIPATCGACHAGVLQVYDSSAHGPAYPAGPGAGNRRRPVCVDCHSAHTIVRADQPQWLLAVVEECGTCHERLYRTYFETYHGKVTRLGFGLVAKCSDCHTAHNMRPASDPQSSVYPLNVVATCAQCHPKASQNFARYYPHGDPTQRSRYPLLYWARLFMRTLLFGVMAVFGVHTLLWLSRVVIDRARRGGGSGKDPGDQPSESGAAS